MEMETKLIAFLILSSLIFFGWWYIQSKMFPKLADTSQKNGLIATSVAPTPSQTAAPAPPHRVDIIPAPPPATLAKARRIKIRTDYWTATISNRGAVIMEWMMTSLPNGK